MALALKMWEEACENESSDEDVDAEKSGDEKDEKDEEEKENKPEKEENQLDAEIRSELKKMENEVVENEERPKKRIAEEEAGANDEYDYVPPARKSRTALSAEERQKRLA